MGIIQRLRSNIAFTLIEMVVVLGVISLALPVLFAIIFTILQQQAKIIRLQEVKKQGDFVLSTMENTIRNYAVSIHNTFPPDPENEICKTQGLEETANPMYFKDKTGAWFSYSLESDKIASGSSNPPNAGGDLTTDKVKVSQNGDNFFLSCVRKSAYSPPIISVNFKIEYNTAPTASTRPEETASLTYQTKIKLRSY